MKISAQEEFGLRCLLQLARLAEGEYLSLRQIAVLEGISVAYAGKLLWILNHAGLVKSIRGSKGGYCLARPAARIMLSEIIKILDEDVASHCQHYAGDLDACIHTGGCTIMPVVEGLNGLVQDALSRISLSQVVEGAVPGLTRLTRIESHREHGHGAARSKEFETHGAEAQTDGKRKIGAPQ
jgi:Rrf2 family transcriptional regulator, iron-sulfur cluster assembly transcription factor